MRLLTVQYNKNNVFLLGFQNFLNHFANRSVVIHLVSWQSIQFSAEKNNVNISVAFSLSAEVRTHITLKTKEKSVSRRYLIFYTSPRTNGLPNSSLRCNFFGLIEKSNKRASNSFLFKYI